MVNDRETQDAPAQVFLKYRIAKSEKLGRYMIAEKDLVAGEVILRESPVSVGPTAFFEGSLCFNCHKPIVQPELKRYNCTKCKVAPLCQPACELVPGYHKNAECSLFRSNQLYSSKISDHSTVLLPLRLWLLRQTETELWKHIDLMEDHVKERRGTHIWSIREQTVVQVLHKLRLVPDDSETSELMQRICGILDVNSFELRSSGESELEGHLLRGLYTKAALMAHNCRSNTHLTVDERDELAIYASVDIKKGATIYFNYTGSLLGSAKRRENLREGKYFECECTLCRDPFELKSNLSSLVCPRCRQGYVGIQNPLTSNPYGLKTKWQCERCKSLLSGKMIKTTLNLTRSLIENTENFDTKALESLLTKLLLTVHTNHYLALDLKEKLLVNYRKEMSAINPRKKILERILNLHREGLAVLDIVEPGISRQKGIRLYEMHLATALIAKKNYAAREISPLELSLQLKEAQDLLRKALSNLLLEPTGTPEGRLAKLALQQMKLLRENMTDANALATPGQKPKTQTMKH
ncbi:SET domain-containing protein SmydA-8 isoform X1 [Neodiprion pinetum]|uniref:SET domain-containing protein SmydA-8 isoform X1 n=2 Tax=Neodiprion pinetum TaxID=441929 RepID=UPI001EE152A6|nr:SET domain-containing protein SmydA-8-like isoform X1 [Neodiprion pinetum]XP_046469398.1 SET domain-containing protein SmydA-8-like isoform X1 [Neodiprion pinetum]